MADDLAGRRADADGAGLLPPLGNIRMTHRLDLVDSPQRRQFGLDKRETLPQYCLDCDVRFACHGGCPVGAGP